MKTPLYPRLQKSAFDAMKAIHIAQLDPWTHFSPRLSVKYFDGRQISYNGVAFAGSPEHVFWSGYIEPFLEDLTVRQNGETIKLALEREVPVKQALAETRDLMLSVSRKTYRKMAKIDQMLRCNGVPNSVTERPWEPKYEKMRIFIEKHYSSEIAMVKEPNYMERWYTRNKASAWILGIVGTAVVGAVVKILAGI